MGRGLLTEDADKPVAAAVTTSDLAWRDDLGGLAGDAEETRAEDPAQKRGGRQARRRSPWIGAGVSVSSPKARGLRAMANVRAIFNSAADL